MWSARELEIKLEYFESPDEIAQRVTVQKYCEGNTCNFSSNRRDQILVLNICSPTEYDSEGKKVGSRNTIPVRIINLGRQLHVAGCWTCPSRAWDRIHSHSHIRFAWTYVSIKSVFVCICTSERSNAPALLRAYTRTPTRASKPVRDWNIVKLKTPSNDTCSWESVGSCWAAICDLLRTLRLDTNHWKASSTLWLFHKLSYWSDHYATRTVAWRRTELEDESLQEFSVPPSTAHNATTKCRFKKWGRKKKSWNHMVIVGGKDFAPTRIPATRNATGPFTFKK